MPVVAIVLASTWLGEETVHIIGSINGDFWCHPCSSEKGNQGLKLRYLSKANHFKKMNWIPSKQCLAISRYCCLLFITTSLYRHVALEPPPFINFVVLISLSQHFQMFLIPTRGCCNIVPTQV